jgi:hypothetical protein
MDSESCLCRYTKIGSIVLFYSVIWVYGIVSIIEAFSYDDTNLHLPIYVLVSLLSQSLHGMVMIAVVPMMKHMGSRMVTISYLAPCMSHGVFAVWGGTQVFIYSDDERSQDIWKCALIFFIIQCFIGTIYGILCAISIRTNLIIYHHKHDENRLLYTGV